MRSNAKVSQRKEEGFVLVIALIMLVAVTLMVVSASNAVQSNLKVVKNMESREVARFAAISAIEEAMSSPRFTTSPENVFAVSCGQDNQKCLDLDEGFVDSEEEADLLVNIVPPFCISVIPIRNSDLAVYDSPAQASCFLPLGEYSMCANSVWEFSATATDAATGAEITVRQGVSILTTLNAIEPACPI